MPYSQERASRLGHVPVVNSRAVRDAFARWSVAQAAPEDDGLVASMCHDLSTLPGEGVSGSVRFAITVDGSDAEVEATREHPTIKVGYVRVAASFIDLERLHQAGTGEFVDPVLLRQAHKHAAFDGALPGSGLVVPGATGAETWRQELDRLLSETRFDEESPLSLADMLLALHGSPAQAATTVPVRRCPNCLKSEDQLPGGAMAVPREGTYCPLCSGKVYLGDVLRTHEEYVPEGSNQSALTRVMLVAERLALLGYMQVFYQHVHGVDALSRTIFITDGPLALHGVVAPLKRRFQDYLGELAAFAKNNQRDAAPLVVGVEKTGRFVEHADLIKDRIPKGSVMALPTEYINRITGRPAGNAYGTDEFYGRRFVYRTTSGSPLVITVPPALGIAPYGTPAGEHIASYPTLRPICEVLDGVQTRLYPNAVIPVALAHSAASLPLGVGQSVLRAMGQELLGLRRTTQITQRGPFPGAGRRF